MDMLCITSRPDLWEAFQPVLTRRGVSLRTVPSLDEALPQLRAAAPALVVLDLGLEAPALRAAVIEVLKINAMIHTAAVSTMAEDVFHDAVEGLGMLMSLPEKPSEQDVERLLDALQALS